jgi:anti-anti-sigma regulatory factor
MQIKIDTKEKFTTITPTEAIFSDIMAADVQRECNVIILQTVKNVIINLQMVEAIETQAAITLLALQELFYDKSASFVICCIQPTVDAVFEELELADILNTTPTESEAWDIVQMEEIERELLDGDDIQFLNDDEK